MSKETELQDSFTKAVDVLNKFKSFYDATIIELDEGKYTCTVETVSGSVYYNVAFAVLTNSFSTIRIVPSVGSSCVLGFRESNQARPELLKVDKLDKIVFFDGTVGVPLTPKTVEQLNTIEQKINDLITVFNSWTPVPSDGGAALKTALSTWVSQTITPTTNTDIENTKILQ